MSEAPDLVCYSCHAKFLTTDDFWNHMLHDTCLPDSSQPGNNTVNSRPPINVAQTNPHTTLRTPVTIPGETSMAYTKASSQSTQSSLSNFSNHLSSVLSAQKSNAQSISPNTNNITTAANTSNYSIPTHLPQTRLQNLNVGDSGLEELNGLLRRLCLVELLSIIHNSDCPKSEQIDMKQNPLSSRYRELTDLLRSICREEIHTILGPELLSRIHGSKL